MPKTGSQPIAIDVRNQFCLAVDDLDGPFFAGRDTLCAAVTFLFVDSDYLSRDHVSFSVY
jgi:hypothetical protein